jgi:cyclopropane fatty-acyl-phospholipid synthase-like methyltransferase
MHRFPGLNAAVWNVQYRLGMWDYIDSANGAQITALLDKYTDRPRILDLGCGRSVNIRLAAGKYRHYHGVDISVHAIQTARKLAGPDTSFEVADILTYETDLRYDAILLREVLYYLPAEKVAEFLRRIGGFLDTAGKIFIQFWDTSACAQSVSLVRNCGLRVQEEQIATASGGPDSMVMVLATGKG